MKCFISPKCLDQYFLNYDRIFTHEIRYQSKRSVVWRRLSIIVRWNPSNVAECKSLLSSQSEPGSARGAIFSTGEWWRENISWFTSAEFVATGKEKPRWGSHWELNKEENFAGTEKLGKENMPLVSVLSCTVVQNMILWTHKASINERDGKIQASNTQKEVRAAWIPADNNEFV